MEGENHISERDDVVIRFSGDSGDGMQMTGKLFTDTAALMGNGISTFPDFPAEIRAPQGTVSGVSGFQVHIGDHPVSTPGDYCDVLVAMNPAALRANARWLKPGATIICDGDTFNDRSVERAGFRTFDPVTEMNLQDYNVVFPHMTSMTREAVATVGLDPKAASKCKNMFALGICFCIYNRPLDHAVDFIRRKFAKKPAVAEANVLALKGGRLQNIALGADANQVPAEEIFLGLFPRDENSDGVTEAPKTRPLQRFDRESELQYYVVWEQYSIDGTVTDVQSCFHNVADGWSLVLPDEWDKDHLTVERSAGSGETAVSFYRAGEGGLREKLLTVYTLTGEAREGLANIGSRFVLTQQVEAVYAARIGDAWNITLDEQSLRERFSLITAEWTMGDN